MDGGFQGALGIDAGGTHTDAVIIVPQGGGLRLLAQAKVRTRHDDLPGCVAEVLEALARELAANGDDPKPLFARLDSVTLGTTLAVNAVVQGRADRVGLALSAGPGLDPARFALGDDWCIVPGGLDHRGVEVTPLQTGPLAQSVRAWRGKGISSVACVGKFSPRNPAHENGMAQIAEAAGHAVSLGHRLAGGLNFPRRVATAFYNAAVARLHGGFLDAVEQALARAGISASPHLLKADGGSVPARLSRVSPVQSILSGPAASVMGVMALCPEEERQASLLLDMGGTTTDIALFAQGFPVMDREGMLLQGRRTLVRSLATVSIGVGGDSLITVEGSGTDAQVRTGPVRQGPACAFGGTVPTLLDALNVLDGPAPASGRGDVEASQQALAGLARAHALAPHELARKAVDHALHNVRTAVHQLLESVNSRPIYTLARLRSVQQVRPVLAHLVGGPAACMGARLEAALGLPVRIPPHADVANAVGAALTRPTHSLDIYADTGRGLLRAPALEHEERIGRQYDLAQASARAQELLSGHLAAHGVADAPLEVLEADLFATLDDGGYGSRDIRVCCQVVPGIRGAL